MTVVKTGRPQMIVAADCSVDMDAGPNKGQGIEVISTVSHTLIRGLDGLDIG